MIGIVKMFADMTYEGARANTGPFLGMLGASAAAVGVVAGLGELLGYCLRSVSGYFADKTHKYWPIIFFGYFINMLAVPTLALAGNWPAAAVLIVAERTGRAIRRPASEALISYAGKSIGHGWVFGFTEALDQAGAAIGPLITALVLYRQGTYHQAFGMLLIPAILCLIMLAFTRLAFPKPHELEDRRPEPLGAIGFSRSYWIYLAAGALIACGFADFSLIAFHFRKTAVLSGNMIPIFYSVAMAAAALAALALGWLLDRARLQTLLLGFFLPALSAPLVFLAGSTMAFAGVVLWGVGMGAQDSALKAVLSGIIPPEKRSTAFGVFDTGFGIAWFVGSAAMGLLYDRSILAMVVFSTVLQLAALPVFYFATRSERA